MGIRRSPRNLRIACDHRGLTHFGGVYFFHEFLQVLQIRRFLTQNLDYPRRNQRYSLAQMILALVYPLVLGLDRLETASFLRSNGAFQYLTGRQSFPDPQTLRKIAKLTGGQFYRAKTAGAAEAAYRKLGSSIGRRRGTTEMTSDFLAGAVVLLVLGGGLSALWAPRLP